MLPNACDKPSGKQQVANPSVKGIIAMLEDEVQDLPIKGIAWSTYWKLCWDSYPEANAYELQTVVGEGVSTKLLR